MAKTQEPVGTDESAANGGGDELLDKLEQGFPPTWIAEKSGDTIVGAFLRLETGNTSYGPAPLVVLGTEEGERTVWLFFESLKTAFLREQPEPGERVAIRYLGEQDVKNPAPGRAKTFHAYRVAVDRPAARRVNDWEAVLGSSSSSAEEPSPADDAGGES